MIGPDLPSHLQSKSTPVPEDDEPEAGPSIGPQVPTSLLSSSAAPAYAPQDGEDEEEDDYVPELPPDLAAARSAESKDNAPRARPQGPAFPSSVGRSRQDDESDDDDDYGPMPLPAGYVAKEKSGVEQFLEREERRKKMLEVSSFFLVLAVSSYGIQFLMVVRLQEASKPKALQREEWMLVPPSSSDLLSSTYP